MMCRELLTKKKLIFINIIAEKSVMNETILKLRQNATEIVLPVVGNTRHYCQLQNK